jgi:catalase
MAVTHEQIKATTTDAGAPVESDEDSLTVGPDGPILLQDHYLIEQMASFNRERIRRAPAARQGRRRVRPLPGDQRRQHLHEGRGVPAGHQGRHADPVFHRGRRAGQPGHGRDPCGFALKFHTAEGNYDVVGNNTPVFFVRDR